MRERQILFETRVGSGLFGTATEKSDQDFQGVFMPSSRDLLGLNTCPTEYCVPPEHPEKGPKRIERKFYSLKRFIQLSLQGQPGMIEMLCAPEHFVVSSVSLWEDVKESLKPLVCTQRSIKPFVGFALAQANKATIKGENLNKIKELLEASKGLMGHLSDHLVPCVEGVQQLNGSFIDSFTNAHGFPQVKVAGRCYDPGIRVALFRESLLTLYNNYGKRVQTAAIDHYDYKSLSHAIRLLEEAEEFLLTGTVTLPRPNAANLLAIKEGKVQRDDWFELINEGIQRLERDVAPKSPLPLAYTNEQQEQIEELCIDWHSSFI